MLDPGPEAGESARSMPLSRARRAGVVTRFWPSTGWLVVLGLIGVLAACSERTAPASSPSTPRLVSLSPAITEVLFQIGAGAQVVGISDYCKLPLEAGSRPRVGTTLTPSYEALAGLRPTQILGERTMQSPQQALSALAPTTLLPWLTLEDVVASTRQLGQLAGHPEQAEALALQLKGTLSRRAPPKALRVLLVIGDTPELSTVWYVKPDRKSVV